MLILIKILIVVLSGIFFRLGGVGKDDRFLPFMQPPTPIANKLWRKLGIGLLIGISFTIIQRRWAPLLCIGTYLLPYLFPYGENKQKWTIHIEDKNQRWLVFGFVFGLASWPVIGPLALLQALLAAWIFDTLMRWSNDGYQKEGYEKTYLDQAYVELIFGMFGTYLYIFI